MKRAPGARIARSIGARAALLASLCCLPTSGRAQGLGLDLSEPKAETPTSAAGSEAKATPPVLGLDLSQGEDFTRGPKVVAIPMRRASGKPDTEAFAPMFLALKEALGARLVSQEATLKALEAEGLKSPAMLSAAALARIATAVGAERAVVFDAIGRKLQGRVYERLDRAAAAQLSFAMPRKMDAAKARSIVDDLLGANRSALVPPEAPPVVAEPAHAVPQEAVNDVNEEAMREQGRAGTGRFIRSGPMEAPVAVVLAGGGTALRALSAQSQLQLVPQAQGAMPALGFDLAFYPLRLFGKLEKTVFSDLSLEGYYRRTFASARISGGGIDNGATCGVDDDEVMARLSYRYPLPGRFMPRVGASWGWTSERVLMQCNALSTRYQAHEVHLKILEPILGEQLQVELAGGPRFLFSKRAAAYSLAFSVEGWITGRPNDLLYLRAGARYTQTRLTSYPQGIPLRDEHTFLGIQIGASI